MAAGLLGTTTRFQWSIQLVHVGNLTIPIARLDVELFLRATLPGRQFIPEQCWLDTGAPLSVIPFHVHNQRLDWKLIPGVKVSWAGQVCDMGHSSAVELVAGCGMVQTTHNLGSTLACFCVGRGR